ncbi:MAG: hypothetical protein R3F37_09435 [Candidatus Competibacteraceae bacterium]
MDRQPLRVILDPCLTTPPTARALDPGRAGVDFTAVTEARYHNPLREAGADIQNTSTTVLPFTGGAPLS